MNKLTLLLAIIVSLSLFSTACGDGDGVDCDDEEAVAEAISFQLDAILDAAFAYSSDPSTANCNRLFDLYEDWIDSLESVEDCADDVGQGDEFREALNDARSALNDLSC